MLQSGVDPARIASATALPPEVIEWLATDPPPPPDPPDRHLRATGLITGIAVVSVLAIAIMLWIIRQAAPGYQGFLAAPIIAVSLLLALAAVRAVRNHHERR